MKKSHKMLFTLKLVFRVFLNYFSVQFKIISQEVGKRSSPVTKVEKAQKILEGLSLKIVLKF